ncbi:flagellar hook-basal body complex protein [Marinovum sp. 2_MG-2023]|uniref:flagellar hook protein FlgE n=1 Tax=Roseobacteraceae TaxID=2854170 RepID=UPI001FD454AC|nr:MULTISPECIES: flagellar hook-basal body complex protein [Roseobacteraceae]MCJ7871005.1 flagellar hook-basal body complex protein [Phaeobacter sp. J2-8]MDO6729789.1 flagellar hook-basal body complex protein [Marinovum sp. 2_MG-2023]MDO6779603.1 flagellar hook-basal body complex protein [Marinovum sp. 1_MG-2023]
MTISSSLNAGVAGLTANATRLAGISDNIANSSTYGYKRVETDFHSLVLNQSSRTYTAGGVRTSTQRMIDQGGSLVTTSNPTDLAVRGRGMLPVAAGGDVRSNGVDAEMLLTTTGSFRIDEDGYLSTPSGLVLMGWPAGIDGTIPAFSRDTADGLEPIQFSQNLTGDPTTTVDMSLNLPATATDAGSSGDPYSLSVEYFDNLGTSQTISMSFTPTVPATGSSNEWTMVMTDSAQDDAVVGEYTVAFDNSRATGGTIASVTTVSGGAYDPATGSVEVTVAGGPINFNIGTVGDTRGLSQLSDSFAPISITKDGSSVGNMTSVEVDENGFVYAIYDSGETQRLYQVPLADMPNPNGLQALDQQTYRASPESGSYFLWDSGEGPTGDIKSFSREESTTDVATELTSMIKTQRAYSSNAKVIQTVDEMLQETTNIKR